MLIDLNYALSVEGLLIKMRLYVVLQRVQQRLLLRNLQVYLSILFDFQFDVSSPRITQLVSLDQYLFPAWTFPVLW